MATNEWDIQFGLVHDCIRACVFGDYLGRQQRKWGAWPAIMDMCYQDAVITWNQIFGQKSQETHWSKFVKKISIPQGDKLKPFTKTTIIQYLNITESEWKEYHSSMVNFRNIRLAHLNVAEPTKEIPNITKALHSCYIYREWLIQALHLGNRLGYKIKITDQSSRDILRALEIQIDDAFNCTRNPEIISDTHEQ